jgi:preprotein translocase subunit SecF
MKIIQKRKIFYVVSGVLMLLSVIFLSVWKLNLGIDFSGGVLMELKFKEGAPVNEEVEKEFGKLEITNLSIQHSQGDTIIVRYFSDSDDKNGEVISMIKEEFPNVVIERLEFISSVVSSELKKKAFYAIFLALIGITLYIAWAFKKVSYPVESWKYGIAAIIALVHDVLITAGVFAVLGHFFGVEVGIPFVAALLTILGYSVNDTIVVFDRIRENLLKAGSKDNFENTVNKSINETLARSINTSFTVVLVLVAIILFGGESIKSFSLALLIGVILGTYSSIFIASAFLVEMWKRKAKKL